jgi:hypothetical protein
MDFQFDATADGRRLKFLNVIDEHSRLCLAIRVGRRCQAKDVVAVLEDLTSLYPAPSFIRSDNGPEFNCFSSRRLRLRRSLAATPKPCEAGARAAGRPRLTSSQDRLGRTVLPSRSTAGSGMSSSSRNCSPRLRRLNSSLIAGGGSSIPMSSTRLRLQAALGPPGGYAPGGRSTGNCRMTTTAHSHKGWTGKGGGFTSTFFRYQQLPILVK